MTTKLIPRLTAKQAENRLGELGRALAEGRDIATMIQVDPPEAVPNPTGGQAVSHEELSGWRDAVRARVTRAEDASSKSYFDLHGIQLGHALAEVIAPVPSDAGHDGVWSFLSLYVFPDLVWERWPGDVSPEGEGLPAARWIGAQGGRDRNYLKTAWTRWVALGDVMESADPPLGEDELVGLLERTAVARNRRLVRLAALKVLEVGSAAAGGRSEFTREFLKRISYQTGSRVLDLLTDAELEQLVDTTAADTLNRLRERRGTRALTEEPPSSPEVNARPDANPPPTSHSRLSAAQPGRPKDSKEEMPYKPRRGLAKLFGPR